jgi:hypothetical protein
LVLLLRRIITLASLPSVRVEKGSPGKLSESCLLGQNVFAPRRGEEGHTKIQRGAG